MLGRGLSFNEPDILDTVRTRFVPVAVDDWYVRRQRDAEGECFRRIADQGPKPAGDFLTRQGLYVVAPDGTLLGYKNSGEFPELTRQLLADGLAKWAAHVPAAEAEATSPAADPRYPTEPPAGGLVLGVRQRRLARTPDGFATGVPDKAGGQLAMRQTLWLTAAERRKLIPSPKVGAAVNVPAAIRSRLARFHCLDTTQGDGEHWPRAAMKALAMTARVTAVTDAELTLRFDGRFRLEDERFGTTDARLRGEAVLNRETDTFARFELVAVCEWARPNGRVTLHASLFALPDPADLADRLPPDGVKVPGAYWHDKDE